MELRGTAVVLRSWHADDASAVAAACSDPEIPRWIPFVPTPYTEEDAAIYVRGCMDAGESRRPFAIVDARSGTFYGSIDMIRWRFDVSAATPSTTSVWSDSS